MKANEARAIAEQKAPKLEEILKRIAQQAESGNAFLFIMGQVITPELMRGLLDLGYSIKEQVDPFSGMKGLNVSW
jgi:hypothetical protein